MSGERHRLYEVVIDEASLAAATPDAQHERRIAAFDLVERNYFEIEAKDDGPYALHLSLADARLVLDLKTEAGAQAHTFMLSMTPFRRVIRDYFMICESYHAAIRNATPAQIEAIDMGRRGLHDEGSALLAERLAGKVKLDHDTARRLFTLICALHVRV